MLGKLVSQYRVIQNHHHFLPQISKIDRPILEHQSIACPIIVSQLTSAPQISHPSLNSNPSPYALVQLIRSCANSDLFSNGEHLHSHIIKSGFLSNVFVSTALVHFYVRCEHLNDAHHLFDEMPQPSVVSWNTLISGYVHSGQFWKALNLFVHLERSNIRPDSYSFTTALSACGQLRYLQVGRSLHSKIVKDGVECSVYVSNCLIDMYGKCGYEFEAKKVFDGMVERDIVSWNSVLAANARNGNLEEAFAIFHQIPEPDTISYNEVIDGVARFGAIEDAVALLVQIPSPNSSSWNSIISGFVNRGKGREGFGFFSRMWGSDVRTDEFTFSSVLSGVAGLSDVTLGSLVHGCTIKCGLDGYVVVGSALIDMYFKCGTVKEGEKVFELLPEKNLVTWNAMISGYGHNGDAVRAIEMFETMRGMEGLKPDEITFLNVISACWHSGLSFKVGRRYFDMMVDEYRIDPMPEHCSLMIRMMGRDGDLDEAVVMIVELGCEGCGMVWKALLGACGSSGSMEVAELAARKVVEVEGENEYAYVMMSNIYASRGRWKEAIGVRTVMKEREVWKECGCSRVEV